MESVPGLNGKRVMITVYYKWNTFLQFIQLMIAGNDP